MLPDPLIAQVPLFAGLPPEELARLAGALRPLSLPAKALLFEEGSVGDACYIVIEGQVEIVKAMGSDEARLVAAREPGELFGEMALINPDGVRTASALARTRALLLEMPRAEFDRLLRQQPAFAYAVMRILSERLRDAANATVRELQAKNRLLLHAYQEVRAAQDQLVEKQRLEHEIQMAREIQERILPRWLPHLEGFDLGARLRPARQVSGDFLDFIPLGAGALGVVVADVCGKGVPAALVMALTRSLLRAEAGRSATPAETLRSVNRHLLDMGDSGMFVTMVYGVLDRAARRLTFVRAGHEPPLLIGPDRSVAAPPRVLGHALGLVPEPTLEEQSLDLVPGSTLLIYTDGLTEAMDARGAFFGSELLRAILSLVGDSPAQALCDRLLEAVEAYHGDGTHDDDLALVAIRSL